MSVQLLAPSYPSPRLLASVSRILGANTLCSMATRSEAGTVDISTVFFAVGIDLTLYFLSYPTAAHSRNLVHVPTMAMTVFDSHQEWGHSRAGLQLFGVGGRVPPDQVETARAAYAARFVGYFDLAIRAQEAAATLGTPAGLQLYRFVPARLKLLDELEFGDEVYIMAAVAR